MALELPPPFDGAEAGAWTEYGRRKLSWTLKEPGSIARNRYEMAWVDVSERVAWKGEPLWLSATRRIGNDARMMFTDAGRSALEALLVPVVARYGFSTLWLEVYAQKNVTEGAMAQAATKRRESEWFVMLADLGEMMAEGLLDFVPVIEDHGRRAETVPVLNTYDARGCGFEEVAAKAMLDGEQVGWMTRNGSLVPPRGVLE